MQQVHSSAKTRYKTTSLLLKIVAPAAALTLLLSVLSAQAQEVETLQQKANHKPPTADSLPAPQPPDVVGPGVVPSSKSTGIPRPAEPTQSDNSAADVPGTGLIAEELTLEKLRDCGVLLHHIRQQAINIYREAARLPVSPHSKPKFQEVHSIPYVSQDKKFLPARTRWLVYFFANIEPVVHDLGRQVNEIKTGGGLIVPDPLKAKISPICDRWITQTEQLNHHLDQLLPLFDDAAHNNLKIQDVAVEIFNDAKQMDIIRQQAYLVIRDNQKPGDEKILLKPRLKLNNPPIGK